MVSVPKRLSVHWGGPNALISDSAAYEIAIVQREMQVVER